MNTSTVEMQDVSGKRQIERHDPCLFSVRVYQISTNICAAENLTTILNNELLMVVWWVGGRPERILNIKLVSEPTMKLAIFSTAQEKVIE